MNSPSLVIVGGPNGAGKTTFARAYVEAYGCRYLGADDIAEELSPDNWDQVRVEAGKLFIRRLSAAIENGESLVVESTLSGRGLLRHIKQAILSDYEIEIAFVFLESAEQCIARVHERVLKGGHFVADEDVQRRYGRSIKNFWHLYRPAVDEWFLHYNSGSEMESIAFGDRNSIEIYSEEIWNTFYEVVK